MRRLEEQIAAAEREAESRGDPRDLVRLGQLYLRAGRPEAAHDVLLRAREALPPLARTIDGTTELSADWTDLLERLAAVEAEVGRLRRGRRREALLERLRGEGLDPTAHDELIRLEVEDEVEVHPETPRCPACAGAIRETTAGGVRCARSGSGADLCRHTDASDLFACGRCGLVLRAWSQKEQGRLGRDPHEPVLGVVAKPRCALCGGGIVSWTKHFLRCPQGRPRDFPICPHCRKRGFHERSIRCPRCRTDVTSVPCLETARRTRRGPPE